MTARRTGVDGWAVSRHEDGGLKSYRYVRETLHEQLPDRLLVVIGKNPSDADDTKSDSTFQSVQTWAFRREFGRVRLVNLFALRSPKPRGLEVDVTGRHLPLQEAVGVENDAVLVRETQGAEAVVAAWGRPDGEDGLRDRARYRRRINTVLDLLHGVPLHGYNWGWLAKPDPQLSPVQPHQLRHPL